MMLIFVILAGFYSTFRICGLVKIEFNGFFDATILVGPPVKAWSHQ